MAYVSGIAGLGNLTSIDNLTSSAISNMNKQNTVTGLSSAWTSYVSGFQSFSAGLTDADKAKALNLHDKAYSTYKNRLALLSAQTKTTTSSTSSWAASPVRVSDNWIGRFPVAQIASSHGLFTQSDGTVSLQNKSTGAKIPINGKQSVPVAELQRTASVSHNGKIYFVNSGAGYLGTESKPAEKGVFDAIGDVFSGVADAAKSLLPTALAVTKAQQERKQQEQLARLQAAGLLPQQQTSTGMSTTTKVALGAGGALLLGFIIYKVATR